MVDPTRAVAVSSTHIPNLQQQHAVVHMLSFTVKTAQVRCRRPVLSVFVNNRNSLLQRVLHVALEVQLLPGPTVP